MDYHPIMSDFNLKDLTYAVIDLKVHFTDIIGITSLKIDYQGHPKSEGSEFNQLVRPRIKLTPGAQRYFSISPEKLEGAPPIQEVFTQFKSWLGHCVLISRFSANEFYAFNQTMDEAQLPTIHNPVLDPFYMAKSLHPRAWEKVIEPIYGPRKPSNLMNLLKLTGEISSGLLKDFGRKGQHTLEKIQIYSCPKSISRAYPYHFQILHDAFSRRLSILIEYPRRGGDNSSDSNQKVHDRRRVDIYGFRTPFMVGYCHLRKAMRTFRLERINRLQLLPESTYKIPEDFNLGGYFMSYHPGAREADLTTNIHFK